MVGRRTAILVLLALLSIVSVAGLWPADDLHPLAGIELVAAPRRSDRPEPAASAIVDTDTSALERILVADGASDPGTPREPDAATRATFGELIRDLAHDDVRGNAGGALWRLTTIEAAPLLADSLLSNDLQQRQLAAVALTRIPAAPTARLAEVLVESMHDAVERELWSTIATSSAVNATRYLYHHPQHARPALRRALWTGDEQQRFLAAFLLGCDGSTDDQPMIVRELVGHLTDNDTSGDAMMAAHALFRLGRGVIPALLGWRSSVDAQARQLIDLIVLDLESPPRTRAELVARQERHRVTGIYHDPVLEFDVDRSSLATR